MSYRVQQHVFKTELPASVPKSVRMQARLVLVALAHFANDDGGSAWPSLATLADMCACTTRSISTHLGTLVRAGLIHVEAEASQHRPTRFRIEMSDTKGLSTLNPARLEMLDAKSTPDTKALSTECTYENVRTKRSDAFADLRTFNRAGTVEAKSDRSLMQETGHGQDEAVAGTDVGADMPDHGRGVAVSTRSQPDGLAGRDRPVASQAGIQLQQRTDQSVARRDPWRVRHSDPAIAIAGLAAARAAIKGRRRGGALAGLRDSRQEARARLFAVTLRPAKAVPHEKHEKLIANLG